MKQRERVPAGGEARADGQVLLARDQQGVQAGVGLVVRVVQQVGFVVRAVEVGGRRRGDRVRCLRVGRRAKGGRCGGDR